jgi:hypothetical protein
MAVFLSIAVFIADYLDVVWFLDIKHYENHILLRHLAIVSRVTPKCLSAIRFNGVIPREVAESIRRWTGNAAWIAATALRSAQNDAHCG